MPACGESRADAETPEPIRLATVSFARLSSAGNCERTRYAYPVRNAWQKASILPAIGFLMFWLVLAPTVLVISLRTGTDLSTDHSRGLVADTARFVHGGAQGRSEGRFLITAVSGPSTSEMTRADAIVAMRAARRNAIVAAFACVGFRMGVTEVTISSEGFTGGSAGLMFALAVVDTLNSSDLTGGRHIAGTGTILGGGAVGRVLSVGPKARAAERAGADLFLVPAAQVAAARSATGTTSVVGIRTLDEAVRLLTGARGCARP